LHEVYGVPLGSAAPLEEMPPTVEFGCDGWIVTPPSVFGSGVGMAFGGATGEPAQLVGAVDEAKKPLEVGELGTEP
jgi:hypothetical protein